MREKLQNLAELAPQPVGEDCMLILVGKFGLFQKMYVALLMGLVSATCGAQTIVMVFAGYHPHRYKACEEPPEGGGGETESQKADCLKEGPLEPSDCQPSRYLDTSFSIVSEFDLSQCASPWFSSEVACSFFFLGYMLGVSALGWVSDRVGRRPSLMLSCLLLQIGGVFVTFSSSNVSYCLWRAVIGMGAGGSSTAVYVLLVEVVNADYRQIMTMCNSLLFRVGCSLVSLVVLLLPSLPSWRALSFVAALPSLLLLFMWWSKYNIESPRWYAAKGKMEQAQAVWRRIATVNRRAAAASLPPLERNHVASADREGLLDVVSTWPFQMWLACMLSMWFSGAVLYYGGALYAGKNAEAWQGHEVEGMRRLAVTNLWCFAFEIIVVMAALGLADRVGRKYVTVSGLLMGGAACLVGFCSQALPFPSLSRLAASAARVFASASFTVVHLYTAELFPTSVRCITGGVSSMGARIAGISAPLLVKVGGHGSVLPLLLFGLMGMASGLAGLLLPETLNRPIVNSLREELVRANVKRRTEDDNPTEATGIIGTSSTCAGIEISAPQSTHEGRCLSSTEACPLTKEPNLCDWKDGDDDGAAVERRAQYETEQLGRRLNE
eukprot:GHVS01038310.1.p1 GENE.GHVS01038310.1~~GHVS01038310.1.p1  ORF type:complete len:609 (+),score=104.12 GHVS01038310.1:217-2043(+)